jgi:hypothetical protein
MAASKKNTKPAPKIDIAPNHGHLKVRVTEYSRVGNFNVIWGIYSAAGNLRIGGEA